MCFFFLMIRRPPRSTHTDTLFPYTTLFRARAHAHLERARAEMILVGRGTLEADAPKLDVRLTGLEDRSPRRPVLTGGKAANGWESLKSPGDIAALDKVDHLLVGGGGATPPAIRAADLVDRLLLYRSPILIGGGMPAL